MALHANVDQNEIALPILASSMILNQRSLSDILPLTREDPCWPEIARVSSSFRVLLAEDNDDLREIMSIFLRQEGCSVLACCDAQIASEVFRSDPLIDILMTDLEMPGRSGLELARELTALRSSLPVIIVSGADITSEMSLEISDREWQYLAKPCGLQMVLETLQLLGKRVVFPSGVIFVPRARWWDGRSWSVDAAGAEA